MSANPLTVLVLCTGNSARSILGEALFNHIGAGRIEAHSAGSNPTGTVNPWAIHTLEQRGLATTGYRSKSWSEFADGPQFDLIVTVCDSAAAETCPVWPGHPVTVHWGIPDPAAATGSDEAKAAAFQLAFERLKERIDRALALPLETLEPQHMRARLQSIHEGTDPA